MSEPLLIDADGDGVCDELIETRNDLPFQHLTPLYPGGKSLVRLGGKRRRQRQLSQAGGV